MYKKESAGFDDTGQAKPKLMPIELHCEVFLFFVIIFIVIIDFQWFGFLPLKNSVKMVALSRGISTNCSAKVQKQHEKWMVIHYYL